MNLPHRITPDYLRDTIVEVRYVSALPFEVLVGVFFRSLDESFRYTSPARTVQATPQLIQVAEGQVQFVNEVIRLELRPNSLIFNSHQPYPGWEGYRQHIASALRQLNQQGVITAYQRVGVRYISHHSAVRLRECTRFTFSFGRPEVESASCTFQSVFQLGHYQTILTLHDNLTTEAGTAYAVIDVDVARESLSIAGKQPELLLSEIDDAHRQQKDFFFNLLTPDYVNTLDPQY